MSTFYFFSLSLVFSEIICCRVKNSSTLALTWNLSRVSLLTHSMAISSSSICLEKKQSQIVSFYSCSSIFPEHRTSSSAAEIHRMEYLTFPLCCPHFTVLLLGLVTQTSVQTSLIKSHFPSHGTVPQNRISPPYSGLVIDKHQAKEGSLG